MWIALKHACRWTVTGVIIVLAGCAVGPDYRRPSMPEAKSFAPQPLPQATVGTAGADGETQRFVASMDIPGQWWALFHCVPLNALLDDALAHNADVDAAHAALQVAWENVYAQRATYFPAVTAGVNPTRQDVAKDVATSAASGSSLYSLTTAQVSVSYSPDLWGGNRRELESLVAQAQAQRFQVEATYLTLTSNLVNAAIEEASLRGQLDATHRMVELQTHVLDTVKRQYVLGDVSEAAVAAQVATLEQSRAALPPLEKQLVQQRDLIAALAGRTPDRPVAVTFTLDDLHLPSELPLSMPAQLLEQRPDVRAAEEALHAASANVGVAIANRLPNIQIDATFGRSSEKASRLFAGEAGFWNLAGNVTQSLFDGGALKHKQRAAEAAYREASAQYRSTVISAMQNVADALHAIHADAEGMAAAERAEDAAARSLDIARRQWALGDISESSLLTAEVTWQQTNLALVQARAARYSDTVALFQSLGGGWWNRRDTVAQFSTQTK
ncbi:efflux transporter outer membrane subunit [Luteibacter flocculans]|uniref:Efflux transporter outer membrane subunit n=1 Tax=Luteibacter flocculans TaxID=2780091 RepID=A0ABY4T0Q5_9GAMM|nr:efflux transporter outer membrane subunit [Luteibacter flocculans]URL56835.1 efflux transporter outer membrane subunit [Luteibacter flocculans]